MNSDHPFYLTDEIESSTCFGKREDIQEIRDRIPEPARMPKGQSALKTIKPDKQPFQLSWDYQNFRDVSPYQTISTITFEMVIVQLSDTCRIKAWKCCEDGLIYI